LKGKNFEDGEQISSFQAKEESSFDHKWTTNWSWFVSWQWWWYPLESVYEHITNVCEIKSVLSTYTHVKYWKLNKVGRLCQHLFLTWDIMLVMQILHWGNWVKEESFCIISFKCRWIYNCHKVKFKKIKLGRQRLVAPVISISRE
jgi:hypothetical protein